MLCYLLRAFAKFHPSSLLRSEDILPIFQYVNATYDEYHSDTIDGAVQEYCNKKGDAQVKSYENTFNGIFSYQNIICSSPDAKAQCKKVENALKCLFNYLDKLKGSSDCEQD
ncbi:hypothetical protein AVEN_141406-1 [Araneus ventricosus]|uniref:Uncharacterized protein n=1 Tax=Araneus ventricosus TaxID=182803 RepID=A0A4Y2CYE1_ARAVE|nr:hypothetical protein AVEN_141406-1 [Araneus ventricosus]